MLLNFPMDHMIHTACRFRTYDPIMFFLSPGWVFDTYPNDYFIYFTSFSTRFGQSQPVQLSWQNCNYHTNEACWSIPVLVGCMNIGSNLYVLNDYSIPIIPLDSSLPLNTHLGFLKMGGSPSHHRLKYTQMIEFWMIKMGYPHFRNPLWGLFRQIQVSKFGAQSAVNQSAFSCDGWKLRRTT